jgi:hypothetical protein
MMRKITGFSFLVALASTTLLLVMTDCSIIHRSNRITPWDDTIPRGPEPKPPATFYNGSFFQHFQIPNVVSPKKDTTKHE